MIQFSLILTFIRITLFFSLLRLESDFNNAWLSLAF